MIPKLIALIACAVLLIGFGASGLMKNSAPNTPTQNWIEQHFLKEVARRAKEQGKQKGVVPGYFIDYPGTEITFDTALQNYSVLVGELIEKKSYSIDSDAVRTWYRFRVVDQISEKPPASCPTCRSAPDIPQDLSLPASDEILVCTAGGTINVDEVELTETNESLPPFEDGNKYLLVVSMTPTRVAMLAAGPAGVYRLEGNGKLVRVDNNHYPMQDEIIGKFAGDLAKLKSHARRLGCIPGSPLRQDRPNTCVI